MENVISKISKLWLRSLKKSPLAPYTVSYKERFMRNQELGFLVKYNGFYGSMFPVTKENNRKFKELLVLGLKVGSL